LIAIGSMNMGLAQTIRSFPREKAIVSNEITSYMYRTLPILTIDILTVYQEGGLASRLAAIPRNIRLKCLAKPRERVDSCSSHA
jgi:hypothetical protein